MSAPQHCPHCYDHHQSPYTGECPGLVCNTCADMQATLDAWKRGHACEACEAKDKELASLKVATRKLVEAERVGLELLRDIDKYQRHADRNNPDAECACCRGELFSAEDRIKIEAMASALADPVLVALRRE